MVYLKDLCVNEELIRNGFAWVFTKYCLKSFCRQWKKIETQAQIEKVGIWSHKDSIPPWEFRRTK